jgi:hypothetical protein
MQFATLKNKTNSRLTESSCYPLFELQLQHNISLLRDQDKRSDGLSSADVDAPTSNAISMEEAESMV